MAHHGVERESSSVSEECGNGDCCWSGCQAAASALAAENPPASAPYLCPMLRRSRPCWNWSAAGLLLRAAAKVIFACSGSADVGKIADLAARKLTEEGVGKMSAWREWAGG